MFDLKRVTIGTDPEFFLEDKKTKKKISAIPHIAGTKYEPLFLSNGSKIQHDNVALEFATEPARDAVDLARMIKETFKIIKPSIPATMDIIAEASAIFDDDQLNHLEAMQFGCDPDFNAWTLDMNVPPNIDTKLRSCGGHLHVGHVDGAETDFLLEHEGKVHTIRMMDTFLGISSIVLDSTPTSHQRRQLYGKAGCYRPTDYGVEYRVLSNFWLRNERYVFFVDSVLQDLLNLLKDEKKKLFKGTKTNTRIIEIIGEDVIQAVINNSDFEGANKIIKNYLLPNLCTDSKNLFNELIEVKVHKPIYQEWS